MAIWISYRKSRRALLAGIAMGILMGMATAYLMHKSMLKPIAAMAYMLLGAWGILPASFAAATYVYPACTGWYAPVFLGYGIFLLVLQIFCPWADVLSLACPVGIGAGISLLLVFVGCAIMQYRGRHVVFPGSGRCHACGYDLFGLVSSHCPECGEKLLQAHLR